MDYVISDKYIKNRVFCNEKPLSVIANMNIDMRWKYDNRIMAAGCGVVNFGFDQNFKVNGLSINEVSDKPISILKDNEVIGYSFNKNNGNWFIKPE